DQLTESSFVRFRTATFRPLCRFLYMRRYFFNIARGSAFIPDPEGDDLPGDEEAKEHAEIVAREMIEERHKFNARSIERWAFIVTDDTGRHVATVPFTAQ